MIYLNIKQDIVKNMLIKLRLGCVFSASYMQIWEYNNKFFSNSPLTSHSSLRYIIVPSADLLYLEVIAAYIGFMVFCVFGKRGIFMKIFDNIVLA